MSETYRASSYMLEEWSRVPFLPTDAHWRSAWKNIVDRCAERFGKDVTAEALARHIKLKALNAAFGARDDETDKDLRAELHKVKAQRDQLMEVVRPFADAHQWLEDSGMGASMREQYIASMSCTGKFGEDDLRKAREVRDAILSASEPTNGK